jgi:ABC-type transport system involved in cytochrome c biogenesis permease subunit
MSSDFQLTWEVMLMSVGISLVLGFVLMLLIRYCAGVITWLFIISFLLLLVASTALSASYYFGYSVNYSGRSITKKAQGSNSNQNSHYFLAAFIILSVLTLVAFIAVFCLCSKIKLSIAIMETSSIFVADNPSSITIPLLNVLAIVVYLCWWVVTAIYLYSMG